MRGDNFNYDVIAKLKHGVTVRTANSDVMLVAGQIQQQLYPVEFRSNITLEASVTPLRDFVVGPTKPLLSLLLGAVGLLLLIACANVANPSAGARRRTSERKLPCELRWEQAAAGWCANCW